MLVPSLSWPGETVVGLLCMVCLGLPFLLALVPPARQGFSTYKEQSRSGDAPTQDGKGWMESDWDARTQ